MGGKTGYKTVMQINIIKVLSHDALTFFFNDNLNSFFLYGRNIVHYQLFVVSFFEMIIFFGMVEKSSLSTSQLK